MFKVLLTPSYSLKENYGLFQPAVFTIYVALSVMLRRTVFQIQGNFN